MNMVWTSTNFYILVDLYYPCYFFTPWQFLIFCQGAIIKGYKILLTRLDQTLEFSHWLTNATLQSMKVISFVSLIFQEIISVLSNVIEFHWPLLKEI